MNHIPMQDDSTEVRLIRDTACTACGCVCDDITLRVRGRQIEQAERACPLGEAWFAGPHDDDRPDCLVAGTPATVAAGLDRAADILASARYPLIFGLRHTTAEAQRAAAALADWLGACLDAGDPTHATGPGGTLPGVGVVTATLGEVRNRGDLIVLWGSDPATTHPRHFSRYSLEPTGLMVPRGRLDRFAAVVAASTTQSVEAADLFLQIRPGRDFEAIWTLRALAKGIALDADRVERQTGVALSAWQALMQRMKSARYGVIFCTPGIELDGASCDALAALVRDLNQTTRFILIRQRASGNLAGAENVTTWRTGYPVAVNLARGYPRSNPGEYSAEGLLARGEVDAALVLASDPLAELRTAAQEHLRAIPYIAIDFRDTETMRHATVAFTTATYGIHVPGTVYRMDEVAITLRPPLAPRRPSDRDILRQLEARFGPGSNGG